MRITELRTGRGGAIIYYESLLKEVFKLSEHREPNATELAEIKGKVTAMDLEDGIYDISGGLISYKGLFDSSQKDGIHACKVRGEYYIELWYNHWRQEYKIVDEAEYERLKTIDPETFDFVTYFNLDKNDKT